MTPALRPDWVASNASFFSSSVIEPQGRPTGGHHLFDGSNEPVLGHGSRHRRPSVSEGETPKAVTVGTGEATQMQEAPT